VKKGTSEKEGVWGNSAKELRQFVLPRLDALRSRHTSTLAQYQLRLKTDLKVDCLQQWSLVKH